MQVQGQRLGRVFSKLEVPGTSKPHHTPDTPAWGQALQPGAHLTTWHFSPALATQGGHCADPH